jgi:hypothetical protein
MLAPAPRTRRRSLIRAGVMVAMILAFGAVVNLGVAWWCVWKFEALSNRSVTALRYDDLPRRWPMPVPWNAPSPSSAYGFEYGWLYVAIAMARSSDLEPNLNVSVRRFEVGWPLRSFWGAVRDIQSAQPRIKSEHKTICCVAPPASWRGLLGVTCLPIGIHPLPFIANTLFYAAVPLGGWLVIGPVRRWRRRRAGRCPACGYDRAGLAAGAVCPECGDADHG